MTLTLSPRCMQSDHDIRSNSIRIAYYILPQIIRNSSSHEQIRKQGKGPSRIQDFSIRVNVHRCTIRSVTFYYKCADLNRCSFIIRIYKTGFQSMFNKDLTPMYDGRVLMNKTAMQDPVVKATLDAMAKRNFEPQRLNAYGIWYISDRH